MKLFCLKRDNELIEHLVLVTDISTPSMTPQQRMLTDTKRSGLAAYRTLAVGEGSLAHFLGYEFATLFLSNLPGLPGFAARALAYPWLLRECGRRPAIGRGVMVRVPKQITLRDGVLIDDYAALDVRGEDASIVIGTRVSIGRFTTIAAKHGHIELDAGCNIGSYCRVATNSKVHIGASVLVGAYCYIGPGNHTEGGAGESLIEQPMDIRGGVTIGEHSWLGARVTVLDGVKIGKNAIIGAHSLVKDDVPDWGVAVGCPARVIKIRSSEAAAEQVVG
jgi:acetyltransferase-like isoleucine patch superfamily enzyme